MGNLADYLCTVCLHEPHTIVKSLCDTHYFEWQEEKMFMELESSTEGIYA
jgi:hypothetical protein